MKKRFSSLVFLAILPAVIGCSPQDFRATPTPTIVPAGVIAPAAEAATPTPPPTVTAIPAPSPTPTLEPPTPIPTRAVPIPTPVVSPPDTEREAKTAGPQAEVIYVGLNVRSGPGLAYPIIGELEAGDRVDVLGVDQTGEWYQISRPAEAEPSWISARPLYTRLLAETGELATVAAPPLPDRAADTGDQGLTGKLVLQESAGGNIYLLNADGSGLRRLTTGIDPALSPDGAKVAFTRWDNSEFGSVWIYDLTTNAEFPVLGETRQAKSPTWSPDGHSIIVNFQHGGYREVRRVCHTYRSPAEIPAPPPQAFDPSIEIVDDGLEFCYMLPPDPHWSLRRVEVATGAFEDLASDTYSYSPAWDPITPWRVLFDGNNGIMQLDVNRDEWWPFTTDLRDHGPTMSPDGSRVAVTYKQHDHWEVYTIDAVSGARARLTKPPLLATPQYNSAAPAWSPDARHVAFVTDRSGRWELWVMNADGSNQRPLLPADVASQLNLRYNSVDERMISWGR